jgi:peptidoglycan/LPS O-acetylase OafA/YrhL
MAIKKFAVLDGLRAISIILVLAAHMVPLGFNDNTMTAGAMGMSLFFALSGFLITTTLLNNGDVVAFIIKRLARIVPLAYLYTSVMLLFFALSPIDAVLTYAFVVNYIGLGPYNWHFWSLCVEMQFYLAIALTVLLLGRQGLWLVWPACIAITLTRISVGSYIDFRTHLRVDEILAGACVAMLFKESWRGALRFPTLLATCAAIFWVVCSAPQAGWLQYLRPYATGAILMVILSHQDTMLSRLLSCAPLQYIANISYALYVIHPVTYMGWMHEGSFWPRAFKRLASFAMTFSLAHLSTFYWESPWRKAASALVARRQVISASRSGS